MVPDDAAPIWVEVWSSGEGDWREACGADIFCLRGLFFGGKWVKGLSEFLGFELDGWVDGWGESWGVGWMFCGNGKC